MQILCLLYKELEHPQDLVSVGLGTNSQSWLKVSFWVYPNQNNSWNSFYSSGNWGPERKRWFAQGHWTAGWVRAWAWACSPSPVSHPLAQLWLRLVLPPLSSPTRPPKSVISTGDYSSSAPIWTESKRPQEGGKRQESEAPRCGPHYPGKYAFVSAVTRAAAPFIWFQQSGHILWFQLLRPKWHICKMES